MLTSEESLPKIKWLVSSKKKQLNIFIDRLMISIGSFYN